ncbi:MAG: D-glycero-beta-D-manno-heptose 1-phosphate adenylyltransferase, partial [Kiritimatiellae bacterium]|nr:D-glycero-beta-D-manno-heptose 1-phosphate adenylyltransferase [Kiritimatiellia bacterium]
QDKIITREEARERCAERRAAGELIAFTNGCFDNLHLGHVDYLTWARQQGDLLVVGLNSDASVRRSKGDARPIVPEQERASVLAALECVDYVVIFDEDEPATLVGELLPNVLVKGEDWAHYVSGREIVEQHGGRVALAKLVEGKSTTDIIEKIIRVYGPAQG